MTSKETIPSLGVSLERDPATNLPQWIIAVQELCASKCTSLYGSNYGLIHHSQTLIEYHAERTRNGDLVGDKPVHKLPDELGANPNAAQVSARERRIKEYTTEAEEIAAIRTLMTRSLGAENISIITNGSNVLRTHSILDIIEKMKEKHFVLNSIQLTELRAQLEVSLDDATKVETLISKHRNLHAQLQQQGPHAEISMAYKLEFLVQATSTIAEMAEIIRDYKKANPAVSSQNFDSLAQYMITQLPNMKISAKAAGYAGFAGSTKATSSAEAAEIQRLRAENNELKAAIRASKASNSGGNKIKAALKYCYRHGYCPSHDGINCTIMAGDATYTPAMKAAKSPTDVAGGCTTVYK